MMDENRKNLPQELLDQLRPTPLERRSSEDARRIVDVINHHGGVANLDRILIGLYQKHGRIYKRRFVQNKLYRMAKEGLVEAGDKKGVYKVSSQFAPATQDREGERHD